MLDGWITSIALLVKPIISVIEGGGKGSVWLLNSFCDFLWASVTSGRFFSYIGPVALKPLVYRPCQRVLTDDAEGLTD